MQHAGYRVDGEVSVQVQDFTQAQTAIANQQKKQMKSGANNFPRRGCGFGFPPFPAQSKLFKFIPREMIWLHVMLIRYVQDVSLFWDGVLNILQKTIIVTLLEKKELFGSHIL